MSVPERVASGRYILILMGTFAVFTGLIYNDIFSKTLHIWESGWDWPSGSNSTDVQGVANGRVYHFGLDPGWHGAENALVFTNSYKMKMSIILGVIHVSRGIFALPSLKLNESLDDLCAFSANS